jgi:hypothetical protein
VISLFTGGTFTVDPCLPPAVATPMLIASIAACRKVVEAEPGSGAEDSSQGPSRQEILLRDLSHLALTLSYRFQSTPAQFE